MEQLNLDFCFGNRLSFEYAGLKSTDRFVNGMCYEGTTMCSVCGPGCDSLRLKNYFCIDWGHSLILISANALRVVELVSPLSMRICFHGVLLVNSLNFYFILFIFFEEDSCTSACK